MARPISSEDAKKAIEKHQSLLAKLSAIEASIEILRSEIKKISDALVEQEVMRILKDIPIEEINREKRGFRIKALHDHGYHTIADIATASVFSIASIPGISNDTAYLIKNAANCIVSKTKHEAAIRLNEDNKSEASTQLVLAISKLRNSEPYFTEICKLSRNAKNNINNALEDLQPATSGIKWLFSSSVKKKKAISAYDKLTCMLNGAYQQNVRKNLEAIERISMISTADAWRDFSANSICFFNILEEINPGILGEDDSIYGLPKKLAQEIQDQDFVLDGLLCKLRRYQVWGVKYILHQERVLLGDEMGLGKTIQAIATMVSLHNTGATHFVVICPASVLVNWCREIQKMSRLTVTKVHGYDRDLALKSWIKMEGVAVTTYETTRYFELDNNFKFSLLVVDEAHYIKNPEAQRTINVKSISYHTERLLFMTGTALENKVDEMISLIMILQPAIAFSVRGIQYLAAAPQFRNKVAPVYYRRKRKDVMQELPSLIEYREWCTMTREEEIIYEDAVLNKRYAEARRVSWSVEKEDLLYDSSKAKRMLEIISQAKEEGRKVIVFSFFLDTISKVMSLLGNKCYGPINGSVTPQKRQEIIDEFDKSIPGSVLAAQIQAGGTGLNIQSASVVIICEPQFKPSVENQAISRAYRMGQTRNVLVYRLLCEDSIDERITSLLERKQEIFDAFADESVAAECENIELDDKTFKDIIKGEIERINAKHRKTANVEGN